MKRLVCLFLVAYSFSLFADFCTLELAKIGNRVSLNRFEVRRGMGAYRVNLGSEFSKILNALKKGDLWIDSGAGASIAIAEHYMEKEDQRIPFSELPNTLSITAKRPTIDELIQKEKEAELIPYQYSEGMRREYYQKRFELLNRREEANQHTFKEEYLEKIPLESLQKAKLITDVMGPFSYTKDITETLKIYLNVLEKEGSVFIHTEQSKTSIFDGQSRLLFDWLKENIKGAEVISVSPSVIRLKRNADPISVPQLKLIHISDGSPPARAYEIVK